MLNLYRSIKIKNYKYSHTTKQKYKIRTGDKVKILRGEFKNRVGTIIKIKGDYVYVSDIYTISNLSSKYARNTSQSKQVNKYSKIFFNNVAHIDKSGNIIKTFIKDIKRDNKISRKNIVDKEGNIIDNFVEKVRHKRYMKEIELKKKQEQLDKENEINLNKSEENDENNNVSEIHNIKINESNYTNEQDGSGSSSVK